MAKTSFMPYALFLPCNAHQHPSLSPFFSFPLSSSLSPLARIQLALLVHFMAQGLMKVHCQRQGKKRKVPAAIAISE